VIMVSQIDGPQLLESTIAKPSEDAERKINSEVVTVYRGARA
jgi:hypothetical protein